MQLLPILFNSNYLIHNENEQNKTSAFCLKYI